MCSESSTRPPLPSCPARQGPGPTGPAWRSAAPGQVPGTLSRRGASGQGPNDRSGRETRAYERFTRGRWSCISGHRSASFWSLPVFPTLRSVEGTRHRGHAPTASVIIRVTLLPGLATGSRRLDRPGHACRVDRNGHPVHLGQPLLHPYSKHRGWDVKSGCDVGGRLGQAGDDQGTDPLARIPAVLPERLLSGRHGIARSLPPLPR